MCYATTHTQRRIKHYMAPTLKRTATLNELREAYEALDKALTINRPENIFQVLQAFVFEEVEHFGVLFLDSANHAIAMHEISSGLVNSTQVHPREAFREAIKANAVSVVFFHNHPSGSTTPSNEDLALTKILIAAGRILQIPMLDHVIIAKGGFYSFARQQPQLFPEAK